MKHSGLCIPDRVGGSILVMTRRSDVVANLSHALPSACGHRITTEATSFAAMNGRASDLVARHDVVIFDAPAGQDEEMQALSELLAKRSGGAHLLALADETLSIMDARKLNDAGVGEVLPNTISGEDLGRIVNRLLAAQKGTEGARGAQGKIVAVAQARGGIGSTTVAVNLARKLVGGEGLLRKSRRNRVAIIDLDLQFGSVGAFLDLEDNGGLMNLIRSGQHPSAADLIEIMQQHESGLTVLCAPQAMVPLHLITADTVAEMLTMLRAKFDFVVIDLPRAMVDWVEPVVSLADRIELVTDTSVPCIRQAKRLIDFFHADNAALSIELIVNRETRSFFGSAEVKQAEAVLGLPFAHWLPDAARQARKAADIGKPLVDLHPGSRLGRAFGRLAAGAAKLHAPAPAARS